MVEIFRTLNKLLQEPDIRNAVSEEYVELYEKNRQAYETRVSKHCQQYALKKLDQIKYYYQLKET